MKRFGLQDRSPIYYSQAMSIDTISLYQYINSTSIIRDDISNFSLTKPNRI